MLLTSACSAAQNVSSPYSKLGIGEIATKNLNEFELPEMDKIESEETQIERQWPTTSFQPNHHVNAVIAEHEMSLNLPAVKTVSGSCKIWF